MKKHLGELGLINRYNNDAHFAFHAKMVITLALVPIEDIDNALLQLYYHYLIMYQIMFNQF